MEPRGEPRSERGDSFCGVFLSSKMKIFGGNLIAAYAGEFGLGQRFIDVIAKAQKSGELSASRVLEVAKRVSSLTIKDFKRTSLEVFKVAGLPAPRYSAIDGGPCRRSSPRGPQ